MKTTLSPLLPFHFQECLRFLNRNIDEPVWKVDGGRLLKLFSLGEKSVVAEIVAEGYQLHILFADSLEEKQLHYVRQYVAEWLDIERDLEPFYRQLALCPLLGPILHKYPGMRLIRMPDLFEAISWAILGQQINLTFAYRLKQRITHEWGASQVYQGETLYAFPEPTVIAALSPESMRPMQVSQRKAEYLIGVAQEISSGKLSKDQLLSSQDPVSELVAIRGVGKWTAEYVLMKCLGYTHGFPIQDVGLHNAIKKRLGLDRKPTYKEIEAYAEKWTGWEGYATFYLWRSLGPD
ncbi:MAG: DNA-3-methyladenine glycosylase [Bacteroidota bacterium]